MTTIDPRAAVVVLLALLTGCRGERHDRTPAHSQPAAGHPAAGHSTAPPAELISIMAQLQLDMQAIQAGLWREDFVTIEQAAQRIAAHPEIQPGQLEEIRARLGPERFEDFESGDRAVHDGAQLLAELARRRELAGALNAFESVQQSCVGCHTAVRSEVRGRPAAPN